MDWLQALQRPGRVGTALQRDVARSAGISDGQRARRPRQDQRANEPRTPRFAGVYGALLAAWFHFHMQRFLL